MRVALLSPTYWPEVRRGTERMVHDLAVGLAAAGHAPRIITSHAGRRPTVTGEEGVPVVRVPRPAGRAWQRAGFGPHTAHGPLTAAALVAGRDDVAHAFYPTDAAAATRVRRRRPCVFSVQGVPNREAMTAHPRSLATWRRAAQRSDAVLALSAFAADAVRRELGVEPRIIAPAVDPQTFRPSGARDPRPTILCAGALHDPRKRVGLLLDAFAIVRRERPDARMVLDVPKQPRALPDGVEVEDLAKAGFARSYSRAWVSALASTGEAFGLVLAEALACGTPVVGAHEGGPAEIVDSDRVGRLFAGDDPADVARALLEALELSTAPGTNDACRRRAADFTPQRMVDAHVALYEELLAR